MNKEFRVIQSEIVMIEYECFIEAKDEAEAYNKIEDGSGDWNEIDSTLIKINDTKIEGKI